MGPINFRVKGEKEIIVNDFSVSLKNPLTELEEGTRTHLYRLPRQNVLFYNVF